MSVINTNPSFSNAVNTGKLNSGQLTQENFMKLLLTQLKMQNPLSPFDASTMMQQMSQLTGLSATTQLAQSVDVLKNNMGTSQVLEASQVVGKEVQVVSSSLQLKENAGARGSVLVPNGVNTVEVNITDNNGKVLKTLNLNAAGEGVMDFTWDGLDNEGKPVNPGFYTFSASSNVGDKPVKLATAATVKVNSVALDRANGSVIVNVDGLGGVPMANVIKIL